MIWGISDNDIKFHIFKQLLRIVGVYKFVSVSLIIFSPIKSVSRCPAEYTSTTMPGMVNMMKNNISFKRRHFYDRILTICPLGTIKASSKYQGCKCGYRNTEQLFSKYIIKSFFFIGNDNFKASV